MKKMLMTSYLSKRKLPINLSEVDISIFEHELSSQIGEVYYLKEKNVRVFNGILFSFRKLSFFMEHTFFKHLRTMYEKTFFERLKRITKGFINSRKNKEKPRNKSRKRKRSHTATGTDKVTASAPRPTSR